MEHLSAFSPDCHRLNLWHLQPRVYEPPQFTALISSCFNRWSIWLPSETDTSKIHEFQVGQGLKCGSFALYVDNENYRPYRNTAFSGKDQAVDELLLLQPSNFMGSLVPRPPFNSARGLGMRPLQEEWLHLWVCALVLARPTDFISLDKLTVLL